MKHIYNLRAVLALFISLFSVSAWGQAPTSKPVISGNATICPSLQTYSMSADPDGKATTYVWEFLGTHQESTSLISNIAFTSAGTQTISAWYRNVDGDGPKATFEVEVKYQPSVTLAPIPQVCAGEEITFEAEGSGAIDTYEWSSTLGDSQKGLSPNFTMNLTGDATITVLAISNVPGCLSAVTLSNVSPKRPTIALASSSAERLEQLVSNLVYAQHLCGDETVTFTETGDEAGTLTWTWLQSDTPATNVIGGNDSLIKSEVLQVTKDVGCSSPLVAIVNFDPILLPKASLVFDGDTVIRPDSSVTLVSGEVIPSYSYQWFYSPTGSSAWEEFSQEVERVSVTEPGYYKVYIEKPNWGCGAEGAPIYVSASDVTSTGNPAQSEQAFYPNPVNDRLFFSTAIGGELKVYNMQGMVVLERNVEGDSVDISELPAGSYVVTLGNLTQRIEVR